MSGKDHDWQRQDSPNPDFAIGKPGEHPEVTRGRLYEHHKRAGSLETFYELYPRRGEWEREGGRER